MNVTRLAKLIGGRVLVHLAKSGEVSGRVDPQAIARAVTIDIEAERGRLIRRLNAAANRNKKIAKQLGGDERKPDPKLRAAIEYAKGSQFGFSHAARIVSGEVK